MFNAHVAAFTSTHTRIGGESACLTYVGPLVYTMRFK